MPEDSRSLKLLGFKTIGKDVSPMRRAPLHPGNIPGTHFCYRPSRPQSHCAAGRIMSMKNSTDIIRNRTRKLPLVMRWLDQLRHSVPPYSWSRGIAPFILNLCTRRRWVVISPRPIYFGDRTPVSIEQDSGWTPEPVCLSWRRENLCPYRDSSHGSSLCQQHYRPLPPPHFKHVHLLLRTVVTVQNKMCLR